MLELIAAIQSADPPSCVLWALAIFAALMYPVGLMLGSDCSPCCTIPPCGICTDGNLPDTVTVTFDGFDDLIPGPDLVLLGFSSCFGSGAAARVTAPGGDLTNKGPVASVLITNGGSGYAKLGRIPPALSISAASGTGAVFTPSFAKTDDACGIPTWSIESIEASGGSGYLDGQYLSIVESAGDVRLVMAWAYLQTLRTAPTLAASVYGSGSGAIVTPQIAQQTDWSGRTYWSVSSFTIASAGSGYSLWDTVDLNITDGQAGPYSFFSAYVSGVDGNGAITSIEVAWGGEFYKDTGTPGGVVVVNGGRYYREDASLAPYVADVEVIVTERAPSDGSGFEITATVETDTSKSTFGKIAALTITNAGNGYLAWQWRDAKCCGDYYNGLSVVLRRDPQFPCRYSHRMCGVGNVSRLPGSIDLLYGQGTLGNQATLFLAPDAGGQSVTCGATFTASEPSPNCSDFASEGLLFTATGGVTATVVAGGVYDGAFRNPGGQRSCHVCCRGAAVSPTEVTVELTESGADGTYVLTQSPGLFISAPGVSNGWSLVVQGARPIEVVIYSCGVQTLDILNPGWEGADAIGLSDCDHCWKKCVVRVNSMIAGSSWDSGQTCAACQDSPVCGPYGTYDLYLSGQFSGRATIS